MKSQLNLPFLLSVLLIFFIHSIVSAQDPLTIYRKFLPQPVVDSPTYLEMAKTNLEQVATIHPDLFYFYLETIQVQFNNPSSTEATMALTSYNKMKRWYQNRRSAWAQAQITSIDTSSLDADLKQRAREYFTGLAGTSTAIDTPASTWFSVIDTNKLDYFALLFLRSDSAVAFDPSEQYQVTRSAIERGYSEFISSHQSAPTTLSEKEIDDDLFRSMQVQWYMLYLPLKETRIDVTPARLAKDYLQHRYEFTDAPPRFYLGGGLIPNRHYDLAYKLVFVNFDYPELKKSIDRPQFTLFMGYRHALKPVQSSFAYVDLELGLALASIHDRTRPLVQLYSSTIVYDNDGLPHQINYSAAIDSANFDLDRLTSASFSISSPVAFPLPDLALKVGGSVVISQVIYSHTYSYSYLITVDNSPYQQGREKVSNVDVSSSKFFFRPLISLEYTANRMFNLELSGSIDYVAGRICFAVLR